MRIPIRPSKASNFGFVERTKRIQRWEKITDAGDEVVLLGEGIPRIRLALRIHPLNGLVSSCYESKLARAMGKTLEIGNVPRLHGPKQVIISVFLFGFSFKANKHNHILQGLNQELPHDHD